MHKGLAAFVERLKALQESDIALSHEDIRKSLNDALDDEYPGKYCYVLSVYGDDSSGDVVYQCGGDTYKCSYEIGTANGKRTTSLDTASAVNVLPRTVYDEEADEADHYASMGEAERAEQYLERFPGSKAWRAPFSERFISKAERDAADSGSFAGKGKSFPILKPGDVMAAVRSMGRAGAGNHSIATLKAHIISIAKKKGWGKYLPKSWQAGGDGGDDSKEAAEIEITGDVVTLREGAVGQDGSAYLKLIAPGWGSSGYYSSQVLERDGPAAFPKGTKNFWNHQTAAEEAARPEGDLRDLASVLTEDAHYDVNGPAGAGLYAKANVFEQFRQPVDSLAKHIGMSIRATGKAKEGSAEGRKGQIIEKLTRGISVDYVTAPGAGGKVLQLFEAARSQQATQRRETGDDMDAAELKKLQESNQRLLERLALRDARDFAEAELKPIRLHQATRARLIERLVADAPLKDGELDKEAFKKLIEAAVKEEAAYLSELTGGVRVIGMGAAPAAVETDPEKLEEAEKQHDEEFREHMDVLGSIFIGEGDENKKARKAFRKGRAA